jgi:hypothetical protein
MPALGEFVELGTVAFAAGGRDILVVDRTLRIGRAEDLYMGILLFRGQGISAMTFIAGYSMFLMYRSAPVVGFCTHEAAARKPGMAIHAGISCFFVVSGVRPQGERTCNAQE